MSNKYNIYTTNAVLKMSLPELNELEPKDLWQNFFFMCGIPHGSGNVTAIVQALKERAEAAGLKATIEASSGNLLIVKEADPGCENAPTVCLQGHCDMVCSKRATTEHDFLKDPIRPRLEMTDGKLCMYANGTTLGADNGIGVSTALAIACDKTLKTGRIEVLVTIDEETTMHGVKHMGTDLLEAKYLLNLDSEDLGVVTIGSAGGFNGNFYFNPATFKTIDCDSCNCLSIEVKGFSGGHSGVDIHHYRGNAIKIMARILDIACSLEYQGKICSIKGGTAHNAIPMDCSACLCFCGVSQAKIASFISEAKKLAEDLKTEYKTTDSDATIVIHEQSQTCHGKCTHALYVSSRSLVDFLLTCPSQVIRVSQDVEGLTESSMNLGKVRFSAENLPGSYIVTLSRSSVNSYLDANDKMLAGLARMARIFKYSGKLDPYGGWTPNPHSKLLEICKRHYADALDGKEPIVEAIHAGLECGEIISRYPSMEAISIGPTIRNPHSDSELCEVETVLPFYNVVKGIVSEIATLQ